MQTQHSNLQYFQQGQANRDDLIEINHAAWSQSYAHIFTNEEIEALFDGSISQTGTWVKRRKEKLGKFVAIIDGNPVGFIGFALLKDGDGEITSFYVHPNYQNRGIGLQLWSAALKVLEAKDCRGAWVWVLEKVSARRFYTKRGCQLRRQGVYTVGNHREIALGYYYNFDEEL